MKGLKKILFLLAGMMFLCASPVLAEKAVIHIPYAVDGGDYWSGLSIANMGPNTVDVEIQSVYRHFTVAGMQYTPITVKTLQLKPYESVVDHLENFFEKTPLPIYSRLSDNRYKLFVKGEGITAKSDLKVTLYVGSSEGFGFHEYSH